LYFFFFFLNSPEMIRAKENVKKPHRETFKVQGSRLLVYEHSYSVVQHNTTETNSASK